MPAPTTKAMIPTMIVVTNLFTSFIIIYFGGSNIRFSIYPSRQRGIMRDIPEKIRSSAYKRRNRPKKAEQPGSAISVPA